MIGFRAWPSIEGFHVVAKRCSGAGKVLYRGKVKLHGTNAAIRFVEGEVAAQSRTRILTPDADNNGFATWLEPLKGLFAGHGDMTVFGEWCGPGIQRGVALAKLDRKVFAAFAVEVGGRVLTDPEEFAGFVPTHPDMFVIPWHTPAFEIDMFGVRQETVDLMNGHVAEVEADDPWVRSTFGVEGTGEGLVYWPVGADGIGLGLTLEDGSRNSVGRTVFKAKGAEHRVNGQAEAVMAKAQAASSFSDFVAFAATDARLSQALGETVGDRKPEMRDLGDFVRWVLADVAKECVSELEASGIEWEKVKGQIGGRAAGWLKGLI